MANRKCIDLPIVVGKNLRKGIIAYRNPKMGGYDVAILWLKKDYKTGETIEIEDIDKVNGILHFCDRESVELTIDILKWILKQGIESPEGE